MGGGGAGGAAAPQLGRNIFDYELQHKMVKVLDKNFGPVHFVVPSLHLNEGYLFPFALTHKA